MNLRLQFAAALLIACTSVSASRNILDNSSFEVSQNTPYFTGSDRWGMFQQVNPTIAGKPERSRWYIDSAVAWHGKQSLRVVPEMQGSYFTVKSDTTYTVSCYAKPSKPGNTIRLTCQAGERSGYVADGPAARQELKLVEGWQRLVMQVKTVPTKSNAYALSVTVYGGNPVWFDAFQVEEGAQATPYAPKAPLEAYTFIKPTSAALGIFYPDEPIEITTRVSETPKPGKMTIIHRLLDYRGKEVARKTYQTSQGASTVRLTYGKSDLFGLYGHFRVHTDMIAGGKTHKRICEAGFAVVPKIEAKYDDKFASRFGCRAMLPIFPQNGGGDFLPQSIVGEEALTKEGHRPPWLFGHVAAEMAKKVGTRWIRLDQFVNWKSLQPSRGEWDWGFADAVVDDANRQGFAIQVIFAMSPVWTHPDQPDERAGPDDIDDWITFIDKVSSRYKGRIAAYEIWNETFSNFVGTPEQYTALLKVAYETIKRNDPKAQVLGVSACPPEYSWRMTKQILDMGAGKYMDAMSYHHKLLSWTGAYPGLPDEGEFPWETSIERLREYMLENGVDKPLWNTEFDVWTDTQYQNLIKGASGGSYENYKNMPWNEGPSAIVRSAIISFANNVRKIQWFTVQPVRGSVVSLWSGGEPVDHPLGEPFCEFDYTPRPTMPAWAAMAYQLAGTEFVKEIRIGDRGRAYLFKGGRGPLAVAWALRAKTKSGILALPGDAPSWAVYDVMSNLKQGFKRVDKQSTMPLGMEPVYIRAKSLSDLERGLSRGTVTGLREIDVISDTPTIASTLTSAEGTGQLSLAVRVENPTQSDIKPQFLIAFSNPAFTAKPPKKAVAVAAGQVQLYEMPVQYTGVPASAETAVEFSVLGGPKPGRQKRVFAVAYATPSAKVTGKNSIALSGDSVVIGKEAWKGPESLSAVITPSYDQSGLALRVDVVDPYPQRNVDPRQLWNGPCVEVFLDLDQTHDIGQTGYNRDGFHFTFGPGFTPELPDAFSISENSGRPDVTGIEFHSIRNDNGYTMTIKLPRNLFEYEPWPGGAGLKFAPGMSVGFGIAVSNRSPAQPGRQTQLLWGGTERNWQDTTSLGTLVLLP